MQSTSRPTTVCPRTDGHLAARRGVTMIEMVILIVVLGILTSILGPKIFVIRAHQAVNEAATVVSTDLQQASSLAAREQHPMVLSIDGSTRYTVRDRATAPADTIRLLRNFGVASDLHVETVSFSPTSVVVFPNGTVSQALTVTVNNGSYSRTITMSVAGLVRVVQP
jgi:type II secretory pathway pseudopilin PulG